MAGPRRRPTAASRTLRLFGLNLLILGGAMVLLWAGYHVLHHPQVSAPPVAVPADLVTGNAPGPLTSGPYALTLRGSRWIAQSSLPAGLKLTFRARPDVVVDYLVLDVTFRNAGDKPLPLTYEGAGQDVRLLLVSDDPVSFYTVPLSPHEAQLVARATPLAEGPLAPGAERAGTLVYAVQRYRKAWSLLFLPGAEGAAAPATQAGPQSPAIRVRFAPGG